MANMGRRLLMLVLLLWLPAALCASEPAAAHSGVRVLNKVHVGIANGLGGGQSMGLHCRSADDDLGQQTVAAGAEYGFGFTVNVFGSTVFYCDLGWGGAADFHFDVFDYRRDRSRCASQCLWRAAQEGVYGFNEATGLWEFMYSWSS